MKHKYVFILAYTFLVVVLVANALDRKRLRHHHVHMRPNPIEIDSRPIHFNHRNSSLANITNVTEASELLIERLTSLLENNHETIMRYKRINEQMSQRLEVLESKVDNIIEDLESNQSHTDSDDNLENSKEKSGGMQDNFLSPSLPELTKMAIIANKNDYTINITDNMKRRLNKSSFIDSNADLSNRMNKSEKKVKENEGEIPNPPMSATQKGPLNMNSFINEAATLFNDNNPKNPQITNATRHSKQPTIFKNPSSSITKEIFDNDDNLDSLSSSYYKNYNNYDTMYNLRGDAFNSHGTDGNDITNNVADVSEEAGYKIAQAWVDPYQQAGNSLVRGFFDEENSGYNMNADFLADQMAKSSIKGYPEGLGQKINDQTYFENPEETGA